MRNSHMLGIAVLLFLSILTVSPAGHLPFGVQNDVPLDTVLNEWGWEIVYRGDYNLHESSDTMFGDITSEYVMLAGIRDGSPTIDTLAAAPASVVFKHTNLNVTNEANGALWYYNGNSMGFAGPGDVIFQGTADTNGQDERDRLSWHTSNTYLRPPVYIQSGWRCGNIIRLYDDTWDRLVLQYVGDMGNMTGLQIDGSDSVVANHKTQFQANAFYDSGFRSSLQSGVVWSVDNSQIASIDSDGVLSVAKITSPTELTVYAEYTEDGTTHTDSTSIMVKPKLEKRLYWAGNASSLFRSKLDGSQREELLNFDFFAGLAIDSINGKIYWIDDRKDAMFRANLDGTQIEYLFDVQQSSPNGVDIDEENGKLYWASSRNITRANIDGSQRENLIEDSRGPWFKSIRLDVPNGKMYWINGTDRTIERANLDGSAQEVVISQNYWTVALELDLTNNELYWSNTATDKIRRAGLDGSYIQTVISNGLDRAYDIELDVPGQSIYWVDLNLKLLCKADMDGGNAEYIFQNLNNPLAVEIAEEVDSAVFIQNLELTGPEEVVEGSPTKYSAIAYYDQKTEDVTNTVIWSAEPADVCTISESGELLIDGIEEAGSVTIYAEFLENGFVTAEATKTVHYEPYFATFYVDSESGNDNNNGIDPEAPLATIQKAIELAEAGDSVLVNPGIYQGEVDFQGKAITVAGVPGPAGAPVIDGMQDFAVSFYNAEGPDAVFKNFVIENSYIAVFLAGSSPTISNLTIVNNRYGIEAYADAQPAVSNCIFWNNELDDIFQCTATYSCIERGYEGQGNIADEPLFADFEQGDYRLHSEMGRYWPEIDKWVLDDVTSPCINTGDPALYPAEEPSPNGGRINMGVYGGTAQASRGPWAIKGDINQDAKVDMADLAIIANNWLTAMPWTQQTD
ncbi:Low-density lipoprotein receptor repeat class B [Anaerohalosphaera lusitana]|uniref:Low-density lipoprotein receptor repeat class B n=1 Tax=Anaerohalosphaera lusitana TaxID=1936003 RepID=A0A1U9NIM4_9BACT|nr:DUF1565 domain-containing protein [Anaerohalosphaera lusitana]AQT67771.1 Low-density lipoprotein receptor repeat class B [Anaerohalosphaera lusitana]